MQVGRIKNRWTRRATIVALLALWLFIMIGIGLGTVIEEAVDGAVYGGRQFEDAWKRDIASFRKGVRGIW